MQLSLEGIKNRQEWLRRGIVLPQYNIGQVRANTLASPRWIHFGAGNIFRGYITALADELLNAGALDQGVIAVESYDHELIDQIYTPHDSLVLTVTMKPDGAMEKRVIAAIAAGFTTKIENGHFARLRQYFENPDLQMVSFTITEKGYVVKTAGGDYTPAVEKEILAGPAAPTHPMVVLTALLLSRFVAGAPPITLVSLDNCSHNGDTLKRAVLDVAIGWVLNGFAGQCFLSYLEKPASVAFPLSMIDKITPRPAPAVLQALQEDGLAGLEPIQTEKGTFIAPYTNTEAPQYLVIEDNFTAARPPLEKAGVMFASRAVVDKVEKMKVCTCLNPLHTALAIFGCLLGFSSIAGEMKDPQLLALVRRIGYDEGLPTVTDPGIISPKAFLAEVLEQRFPNPAIPDTPQRIATDTSQKLPIRFGVTIRATMRNPQLSVDNLVGIPLVLAGWLRYCLAVDDEGREMPLSPDPVLPELRAALDGIQVGDPASAEGRVDDILSRESLFGVDLHAAGLAPVVEDYFKAMLKGPGAVRELLTQLFPE